MMLVRLSRILIITIMLALPARTNFAQNATYIFNHTIVANILSKYYGIPAPVILSIAAIESAGGSAPVARVLKNHFGIVGSNEYVNHLGHKSRYKQYDNEIASYIDFCDLISRKSFYRRLKNNSSCTAWVKAISKCGYSEVPEEWEQKVMWQLSRIGYQKNLAVQ